MGLKVLTGIELMSFSQPPSTAFVAEFDKLSYSLGVILAEQDKSFVSPDVLPNSIKDVMNNKALDIEKAEMLKYVDKARQQQEKSLVL